MINKKIIHYMITAALCFGFGFLPPIEPITPLGMVILGTFLGVIYGWTTLGMIWPSLIALVSLGMTIGMWELVSISFGNLVVVMLVPLFIMIALLNETKVTEIIASYFVSNKLVAGRPWLLIFLFLIGVYICTIINPFVAIILFVAFLRELCQKVDIKPYTPLPTAMMVGFALAAMLGQIMFPFLSTGILLSSSFSAMNGQELSYGPYILYMIPLSIVLLAAYVMIMRFVLRVDVSQLKSVTPELFGEKKKMDKEQKTAFSCFILTIMIIPLNAILPQSWALTQFLTKLTMFGEVVIAVAVLMLFTKKDGTPLLDFSKMASEGLLWDVILMLAYIMPISNLLPAENTGITAFLGQLLAPMTVLPPIVFIVVILFFATVVTNFANNAIIAIAIMPLLITFADQVGLNPASLIVLLFITTQLALATPGGSPMTGLCYAYTDIVKAPMMMKYAAVTIAILFVVCLAVGFPYALLIF